MNNLFTMFSLLMFLFLPVEANEEWRIGGKIHFEEENGSDYMGTKKINRFLRDNLEQFIEIESDSCADNAKILLTIVDEKVVMTHYEERSKPGVGEEMHATLLYTKPRGFCDSETLQQVCQTLFGDCVSPPTVEEVAKAYDSIIQPEWRFKISEVVWIKNATGSSFISAKLLFEEKENLYNNNKPISAGLHMTLVNVVDHSIISDEVSSLLVENLNRELKGKWIKVGAKNGIADLEFGISGSPLRIRANERT